MSAVWQTQRALYLALSGKINVNGLTETPEDVETINVEGLTETPDSDLPTYNVVGVTETYDTDLNTINLVGLTEEYDTNYQTWYASGVSDDTTNALMELIGNRLYDEPPKNSAYPYVVMGDVTEIPDNRHTQLGYELTTTFHIYTKPGSYGFKPAKEIMAEMNEILNMVKLPMDGGFTMIMCRFENAIAERDGDKRIISIRYRITVH